MNEINEYGNGRKSVIDEIKHYIDSELGKINYERRLIPKETKDVNLSYKRATLAGNIIALNKISQQLKKKEKRMQKFSL